MPCKIQILAEVQSTSVRVSHLKCNITLGEPGEGEIFSLGRAALAPSSWY